MKILLINLPREGEVRDVATPDYLLYDFMNYPPLGLLAIAAGVDRRHSLEVVDVVARGLSIEGIVKIVCEGHPDLLGISVVTRRAFALCEITRRVKSSLPGVKIVVGGPHVSAFPTETMYAARPDFVLPGYGEMTFPALVEALDRGGEGLIGTVPGLHYWKGDGVVSNPPAAVPLNIDDLPIPDRSFIRLGDYFSAADKERMTTMYTSRGCPFRCIFCDVGEKTFRYRSPSKIVDEFEYIGSLGIKEIHIFDDTFNVDRGRVIDVCREILRRKVKVRWSARARVMPFDREMAALAKEAGCRRLHVGVEAFDDGILKAIRKNITLEQIYSFFGICNEFGIDTLAYFIVGFPQETEEYRRTLYARLRSLKATYLYLNILYPTAKSLLYEEMLKNGVYRKDYWGEFIRRPVRDFELPLCRPPELQQELIRLVDDVHRNFYLSPRFIMNDLRRNMNMRMFLKKAKIAIKLLSRTAGVRKGGGRR